MKHLLLAAVFALAGNVTYGQYRSSLSANEWVDSVYHSLNKKQRIAQTIIIRAHSNKGQGHVDSVLSDIKKYKPGGLCFFQGGPVRQAVLTNLYQSTAKTPLLVSIDGEWGLGMRLDSVINFPRQMMLGAMPDATPVYDMGRAIGRQCKRMGIHLNYAPVVDVNNNPDNPVINDRSFGEDKYKVALFGIEYMKGMQDEGIIACAKHFPGHGDVTVDSHSDLPVIFKTKQQLDSLELYPFKAMIKAGVKSIMIAHLFIPSIDSTPNQPTSLSHNTVTDLLRNELGYKGLTVTDGLEMKGVTKYLPSAEGSAQAIIAGNDLLCLPEDLKGSIKQIRKALRKGKIDKHDFEARVRKILLAKYEAGLYATTTIDTNHLVADLNSETAAIKSTIAANSMTVLKLTDKDILPLRGNTGIVPQPADSMSVPSKNNRRMKTAVVCIGTDKPNTFATTLQQQFGSAFFAFGKKDSATQASILMNALAPFEAVIIGIHNYSRRPANRFGISAEAYRLINNLQAHMKTITFVFGNPYAIKNIASTAKNLVVGYEDDDITQTAATDLLQGINTAHGKLPVSVTAEYGYGSGIAESFTMPHDVPENVGMQSAVLNKIDSIALDAIAKKATPGCVVLVAKDGKVVFDKAYGYTYVDGQQPVRPDMIYDLASVTKVAATTIAVMKLYEDGRLNLDRTIGDYLPWTAGSNKADLRISDVLLHQAGMKAWIPFYEKTIDKAGLPLRTLYSYQQNDTFSVKVADGLFMRRDYVDTMFSIILNSKLGPQNTYEYSDNDFIFLGKIVESITRQPLENYMRDSFYIPLQMTTTRFRPKDYFPLDNIVPTATEISFRQQTLQGDVHDPAAAMMGGVAGHAGLFSNAYDLAKLFQMLLNGGTMNGVQYLQPSTISKFTGYGSEVSRRGLGFDKPEKDNDTRPSPYPAAAVSPLTFGHTGFTGTCVWADPANNLLFIFLSNRVAYDKGDSNKLLKMKVRGAIQDVIYKSMGR